MIILLAIFLLAASTARAQVKQWVDEKGVTHFEAHDTGKTPSPKDRESTQKATPGKTTSKIDRSHAGLTLGENDSSTRNTNSWMPLGHDEFGAAAYASRGSRPKGVVNLHALYIDGRLASIRIFYEELFFGSWKTAVDTTAGKYGPPETNGYSEAKWSDGQTALSLIKDYKDGITALLVDHSAMREYAKKSGRATPKF